MTNLKIQVLDHNPSKWWTISSIDIIEREKPSEKYLYWNPKKSNSDLITDFNGYSQFILYKKDNKDTSHQYPLESNESFGIDFNKPFNVNNINLDYTEADGIELQASIDGVNWDKLEKNQQSINKPYRFVRLINKNNTQTNVSFKNLIVNVSLPSKFGKIIESTIGVKSGKGDNRTEGLEFDNKMDTKAIFGSEPKANEYILYDLGKEVSLNSLRIYTNDTVHYPRYLEVLVSTDNKTNDSQWTKVLTIGNITPDTQNNDTFLKTNLGQSDPKYPELKYFGKDDIQNLKARYIKLLIKANYPNERFLHINEIVLNNGEYIARDNDPRFSGENYSEGDASHTPGQAVDKNSDTYYQPAQSNGTLKYYLDKDEMDGKDVKFVIKDGDDSNAQVTALVLNENTNQIEKVSLGTLSNGVTSFRTPSETGKKVVGFEIAWKDKKPSIAEIIPYTKTQTTDTNKDALQALVNQNVDTSNWTQSAKDEYTKALENARQVLALPNVTQETVDAVKNSLQNIINDNNNVKVNTSELNDIVNNALSNEKNMYTEQSFRPYQKVLDDIKEALKDDSNISQAQFNELKANYEKAKQALKESQLNRQLAELSVKNFE
ncbi:discoidin domain-containing protein [Mycoplasma leonicaptivi]|uniref:discoidin domain-containing protein n=1 Tax=Mycoplasma leonicaptivi TaxID=36742 RepID=UPI0004894314|nr:discoidin domain-containing protein [Mycoplasma leonicaptivi]